MKRRISTILLILALASTVWAAPNTGSKSSRISGSALSAVDASISLVPSATSGEAPLAVDFTVTVHGTSLGTATWFHLLCNDDDSNILPNTGSVVLQSQGTYSATYVIDGVCIYESAGAKTATLWYEYRGSTNSADADITVTESVGSIDVQLGVEPLGGTEIVDLVLTATVTGETSSNVTCEFWCDADGTEAFGDGDESGSVGPQASGTVVFADPTAGFCDDITDGEWLAAVACQRNGQEDEAYVPYTIYPDTITVQSFGADPAYGNDPLAGVELEASVTTTCLTTDNITFQFDCLDDTTDTHSSGAVAISTLIDEEGVVTYNTQDDGAFDCGDFTPDAIYTPSLTVDCGNAVQATATTNVVVTPGVTDTFWFDALGAPAGGVEPQDGVEIWVFGWGGTATGDVTIDAVNCDTTTGDDFAVGYNIGDVSTAYNLVQQGITCDYATDDVYEGDVDGTRDGVSFTDTFYVTVTPQSTPPIFQLSETSFNRTALYSTDADDVVFTVGNIGGGNLEWVGVDNADWLACTPDDYADQAPVAGPANGESEEITCTITSSTLDIGSYSATVTYTDPAATPTSPDTPVTVSLTVTSISTPIHLEVDTNYSNVPAGPSPLAVSFSTVDASLGTDYTSSTWHETSTINPFTDLYYEWDFGDDDFGGLDCQGTDSGNLGCRWSAITTANGANAGHLLSRNYMTGPLGAHVYEPATFPDTCTLGDCAIYYPTLTATDANGNTATWNGTVNVYDPDGRHAQGWGDANETYCISAAGGAGNFIGCPGVGQQITNSGTAQSIITSYSTGTYKRILFHAGEIWSATSNITISNDSTFIGSYGSANDGRATFNHSSAVIWPGKINLRGEHIRFQDIEHTGAIVEHTLFVAASTSGTGQAKNLLLQRQKTANGFVGQILTHYSVIPVGADSNVHRYIFIVDNEFGNNGSGLSTHKQLYIYGKDWSVLGNVFGNSPDSHNIRIAWGENILISNNLVRGGTTSGNAFTTINIRDLSVVGPEGSSFCAGKPHCGDGVSRLVIADNDIQCVDAPWATTCVGGIGADGGGSAANASLTDFIMERNYLTYPDGGTATGTIKLGEPTWTRTFIRNVVRNNVLDSTNASATSIGIWVRDGVDVYNNTCYRSDGTTVYCVDPMGPSADNCLNNVLYAPLATTADVVRDVCTIESNNFDNGVTGNITSDPFFSAATTARWGFWPKAGSPIQDGGYNVQSVFDDAILTCRKVPTGGAIDAGALEYPYAAGDGSVDGVPGCR